MGFFEKLKAGLAKTKNAVFGRLDALFRGFSKVDEEMLEELEEVLITADVGVNATETILDELRDRIKKEKITEPEQAKAALQEILTAMIGEGEPLKLETTPAVILVIGVNGVGKTTSIAKIANVLKNEGWDRHVIVILEVNTVVSQTELVCYEYAFELDILCP